MLKGGRKFTVPSVTTALQVIDKPALIPWAINQAIEFIRPAISPGVEHAESYLEEVYERAKRASRTARGVAADIGTQAHAILQRYPDCGTVGDDDIGRCVDGAISWLVSNEVGIMERECPIYSRRYRYSGRFDGLARIKGVLSLIDWKTSSGMYPEFRLQTAAYVHAYEEEHPSERIEQRVLVRLGKTDGVVDPHIYTRDSLRADFQAFLAALRLHNRLKAIKQEEKQSQRLKKEDQIS